MKTLNYQGTVAFFKNGRLDTMKHTHVADQKIEQERLLSLNSPMREVIRDAGTISCIFNKSKKVIVNHRPVSRSFIVDLPIDFSALNTIYRYSLGEEEFVAMRSSQTVFIKPVDQYRYPRKIWIDREYFLPLKVEVYNLAGETLEQVVYTDIQVVDTLKFVKVEKNLDDTNITHIHLQETDALEKMDFILDEQAIGFHLVFFTRMDTGISDKKVDHLLLSDGFSSVSVYREVKSDDTQLGVQTLGTVNSFTRIAEDYQITAMGDVPVKAVEEIAQGIAFQ
ncbi:MAG: outer membrane lipoprotein-sorting protein [Methylococcales symbiont of Iophon sp. n. MRB-2018]|nr:MAG: outer membrane lipoprotein-sorting protein [Methylococcales symbiont of Iophon sp. n. MRB-2018]